MYPMNTITLQAIEELLDHKLDERLAPIEEVLRQHTAILEKIVTPMSDAEKARAIYDWRMQRLEKWAIDVGHKVHIPLEV